MSAILFPSGREGILDESINMNSGDIRAMLVKSSYAYNSAHVYLADIGAVDNGRTTALLTKTFTAGVFDAADITLTTNAAAASNSVILFKHTGVDATARLVAYDDSGTGIPFTPAAGQIVNIQWDNGANKIFKL
jgi:hypothetical protein